MTEERRQSDVDLSDIRGDIREINTTLLKLVEPAVTQTYKNKDVLINVVAFQKVIKYVGGLTVITTFGVAGRLIYGFMSKHPPPPPPPIH